jgi:hypothetical protein
VLPCVVWKREAGCHTQYPLEVVHRRERWACRCAPSGDIRQEMQVRSFSAVRVLVQPKLWCCVCLVCEQGARAPHPISAKSRRSRGLSARPWMGASLGHKNSDSLDMTWLPLPRFESREVCVAVPGCREREAREPHTIPVGSRLGACRWGCGWAHRSDMRVQIV